MTFLTSALLVHCFMYGGKKLDNWVKRVIFAFDFALMKPFSLESARNKVKRVIGK